MADEHPTQRPADPVTYTCALENAARLLYAAEMTTDHSLMERLERLADSWVVIARTLTEREA